MNRSGSAHFLSASGLNILTVCVCLTAGRGRDEEPRIPETQEDPGGAEHRQDGEKEVQTGSVGSDEFVLTSSFRQVPSDEFGQTSSF